jgi:hypothetical protein
VAEATVTLAGDAAEGFRAVSWVRSPLGDSPELQAYRDAMEEYAPDQPVDTISLVGYGLGASFCEIVKTIDGPVTSEAIVEAYDKATDIETGAFAPLSFSETEHMGTNQLMQVEVKDGVFTELTGEFITPPELQ